MQDEAYNRNLIAVVTLEKVFGKLQVRPFVFDYLSFAACISSWRHQDRLLDLDEPCLGIKVKKSAGLSGCLDAAPAALTWPDAKLRLLPAWPEAPADKLELIGYRPQ